MPIVKYTSDGSAWNPLLGGLPGPQGPTGGFSSNRNWVVNGDFSVNQRGFTAYSNPTGVQSYSLDQWRMVNNHSVGTVTFSPITAALGELPESSVQYMRVDTVGMTEAGSRSAIFQQFDEVRAFAGGWATVSFWAKANAGTPYVGVEIRQSMANGGAGTTTQSKKVMIGTTWARYYVTIWVPTLAGKTIADSTDHVQLLLWTSSGTDYWSRSDSTPIQNAIIDIWGVQAEKGERMGPFEFKPYGETLRDCQRYFQRWKPPPLRGVIGGGAAAGRMAMVLPVPMRIKPATTLAGTLPVHDGIGVGSITAINTDYSTPYFIEYDVATSAVFSTTTYPCVVYQDAASGYIDLNAGW